MNKRFSLGIICTAMIVLIGMSPAYSYSCPVNMAAFDKAVAAGPKISPEKLAMAIKLRKKAEEQHDAGDHGGSIESINKALDLIESE